MKIELKELKTDESNSNNICVAIKHPKCPIRKICFYMVSGFGSIINECSFFEDCGVDELVKCNYGEENV